MKRETFSEYSKIQVETNSSISLIERFKEEEEGKWREINVIREKTLVFRS